MAVFDHLELWADETPRGGPGQMAVDEALLEMVQAPVLRVYRWAGEWCSFGYSQSYAEAAAQAGSAGLVRRWTGGGVVDHRADWTFALVIPRDHPFTRIRPSVSYCEIHQAMAAALEKSGFAVALAPDAPAAAPGACFAGTPAHHDVLERGGGKLCGGAQRRCREGVLHQGSLQGADIPEKILGNFVTELAASWRDFCSPASLETRAAALSAEKYETPSWTQRHR